MSKSKITWFHLYPGVLITIGFALIAPIAAKIGFPPMFAMLMAILLVALPVFYFHLNKVRKQASPQKWSAVNGLQSKLPLPRLILYSVGLVLLAFAIWGITQPITEALNKKIFNALPDLYNIYNLDGYERREIIITLVANLILNGFVAPFIEEIYFRGYLLARMDSFGKRAFLINAVLFSFYHFWQPQIYITLILALLPLTYAVWRTQDIRLSIVTHVLMNIVGTVLSFAIVL